MRRFHYAQGAASIKGSVFERAPHFGSKLSWFLEKGYQPHLYQLAFHTLSDEDHKILQHRFLVAGRRGGKTISAAWEVAFYCLHPEAWHWDVHRKSSDEPLHVWILVPNFRTAGRAAMRTFEKVLKAAGLKPGKDYKWNKGEFTVEFPNESYVEFKTAEQADSLVGAGIHILWIDETAVIPDGDAYEYATPALDDHEGIVIGTTTPRGKNWFYDLGWAPEAVEDETIGTVEYTSIHNPYFPRKRWEYRRKRLHPSVFKREYMAAFDSNAGKELQGDWLTYYEWDDLPLVDEKRGHTRSDGTIRFDNLELDIFIGIDPAISLSDAADSFAVSVLGITKDRQQGYLLEAWKGRIAFPDQVELISRYHLRWRPQLIGVEDQAYQAALVQQAMRLSTMPPIVPQRAKGKKSERILSMAPNFKIGQIKIRGDFRDFIDEWLDYDSERKNPKDDLLDATEIAMRTAGMLLPGFDELPDTPYDASVEAAAARQRNAAFSDEGRGYDEHMGAEW